MAKPLGAVVVELRQERDALQARVDAARAAYLSGDWDALEAALDISDGGQGRTVAVRDLLKGPPDA